MAFSFGAKSRKSASSLPSRGYISSPSAFASSSTAFMSRPSSTAPVAMYRKSPSSSLSPSSSAVSSVRFQIDQRSASPSRSISVQKNRDRNANAVPSNKKKTCMCSPTKHPGSFRCSLHKNSRQSVNVTNRSQFQNRSLNIRRSAMTNSLVRIGCVEGADLVKRVLSALIRPSSHQQRRRSAFQPRPSRLSVMSRAEEEDQEDQRHIFQP
ncbi:uncharacterized protein LOC120069962 [Benincasa hispida]|uniref:uncharacterized protein LOC120069962 n=1 Tax=Benincasa hispida TaxID=102211 RepID=UPI001900C27F|nr:uncharacterized protein LOC120069962 [Benincasa hispida]